MMFTEEERRVRTVGESPGPGDGEAILGLDLQPPDFPEL